MCPDETPPKSPPFPGADREIFVLGATEAQTDSTGSALGGANIQYIQGIFSQAGAHPSTGALDGTGGPDNGATGCLFVYYPAPVNALYISGGFANGSYNFLDSSPLPLPGATGVRDLTNPGFCTIHSSSSTAATVGNVFKLRLDIEFLASAKSSNRFMYSSATDARGLSTPGAWTWWGYWYIP